MANSDLRGIPTKLGHLALRVRDLDRSVEFYRDVVGLPLREKEKRAAFLGVREDASHEIALFQLSEEGIKASATEVEGPRAGLYHMAWEMASFGELERLHERLVEHKAKIVGYSPRQCNVMFHDPDGNELEAIWQPPHEEEERLRAVGAFPNLTPQPVA